MIDSNTVNSVAPGPQLTVSVFAVVLLGAVSLSLAGAADSAEIGKGRVHAVIELALAGPRLGPRDAPARDVELWVRFQHEGGEPACTVHGFWDGDGKGRATGNVFKVRFCPTAPGKWLLAEVRSNAAELAGQHQGDWVTAVVSTRPGFWIPDPETPGQRWYKRSDGSHPYIFGNTHYTFLSGRTDRGPNASTIEADIRGNARFFKKLRFSLFGGRYVHPTDKPFLDDAGKPTDDGDFSHRPNPAWFHRRADVAVRTALEVDLIADLILNGPDTRESRSALRARRNGGDPAPFLRYVAARYGSYPNVWFCLANEWDIKNPRYTPDQIAAAGTTLRKLLPYPTPISVHGRPANWNGRLNTRPPWHDHVSLQGKIRTLARSADFIARNHVRGGRCPVVNDELGYEGRGDRFSRDDVLEGHLGAFLGGGYGTTGWKPASKKGHYFWGAFEAAEHTAAKHLAWLRAAIDKRVALWRMAPVEVSSLFDGAGKDARAMAWPGREIVLGTNAAREGIVAKLPPGRWRAQRFDVVAMKRDVLAEAATGRLRFDVPASRAVAVHFEKAE